MKFFDGSNAEWLVWDQVFKPTQPGAYLLTVKEPSGCKYTFVDSYLVEEGRFGLTDWLKIVAVARPAKSLAEFNEAEKKGMSVSISWRRSGHPVVSKTYLLAIKGTNPGIAMDHYTRGEEDFDSWSPDFIAAWAPMPEACEASDVCTAARKE